MAKGFKKGGKFRPIGDTERRKLDQQLQDAQEVVRAMADGHTPHEKSQLTFLEKKISSVRRQMNRVGQ